MQETTEGTALTEWEVPEHRWGPYLKVLEVRAPDFEGPATHVWLEANEQGEVVGFRVENASGQSTRVSFPHPAVVGSQCGAATICEPLRH